MSESYESCLAGYREYLIKEEKSGSIRKQYERDIRRFLNDVKGKMLTKELVIEYKEKLQTLYRPSTVNVILAALNGFLEYMGQRELKVKQVKIQRLPYCSGDKELVFVLPISIFMHPICILRKIFGKPSEKHLKN